MWRADGLTTWRCSLLPKSRRYISLWRTLSRAISYILGKCLVLCFIQGISASLVPKNSFAFESCWPRKHDVFESECFKFYDCHFVFWEFSVEFMECWLRATVSKVCWDVLRLIHGSVCHLKSKLYLLIVCLFCFCGVITRAYCTFPYSGAFSQCILWSYSFCGPWIYKLKN